MLGVCHSQQTIQLECEARLQMENNAPMHTGSDGLAFPQDVKVDIAELRLCHLTEIRAHTWLVCNRFRELIVTMLHSELVLIVFTWCFRATTRLVVRIEAFLNELEKILYVQNRVFSIRVALYFKIEQQAVFCLILLVVCLFVFFCSHQQKRTSLFYCLLLRCGRQSCF